MPLPRDISVERVFFLLLGLDPDAPPSPDQIRAWVTSSLATALEIPPLTMEQWIDALMAAMKRHIPEDAGIHGISVGVERLLGRLDEFNQFIPHLENILHADVQEALLGLLKKHLRVDLEDLAPLMFLLHRQRVIGDDEIGRAAIDFFKKTIPIESQLRRAVWHKDIAPNPQILGVIRDLPVLERIQRAIADDTPEHMVHEALRAWAHTYETTMLAFCRYLWLLVPGRRPPPTNHKQERKRDYWTAAVNFCRKGGLKFPFYTDLPWLRNFVQHGNYALRGDDVVFPDKQGDVAIPIADLVYIAFFDITYSSRIMPAYSQAVLELRDDVGEYDEAWQRIVSAIPELQGINPASIVDISATPSIPPESATANTAATSPTAPEAP